MNQKVYEFGGTVERVTGPSTVSEFLDKGTLSFSEFIVAGDYLVSKDFKWTWMADASSPSDKQFLLAKDVYSFSRAVSVKKDDDDGVQAEELKDDDLRVPPKGCREYHVSITYDKYYRTPRIWLKGYDMSPEYKVLEPELMLEDISPDHTPQTVTLEDHPHELRCLRQASVHPCKHADVMKQIIDVLRSQGVVPEVDKYLFIFLKYMMTSVMPTIEIFY